MAALLTLAIMLPGGAVPPPNVATAEGRVRVDHRVAVVRPYRARFERIARCESGSNYGRMALHLGVAIASALLAIGDDIELLAGPR